MAPLAHIGHQPPRKPIWRELLIAGKACAHRRRDEQSCRGGKTTSSMVLIRGRPHAADAADESSSDSNKRALRRMPISRILSIGMPGMVVSIALPSICCESPGERANGGAVAFSPGER